MPRSFTKFASKSYQGTGLGLFIAKGISEAHMGKIWGKNNVDGIGATFSFGLPKIWGLTRRLRFKPWLLILPKPGKARSTKSQVSKKTSNSSFIVRYIVLVCKYWFPRMWSRSLFDFSLQMNFHTHFDTSWTSMHNQYHQKDRFHYQWSLRFRLC